MNVHTRHCALRTYYNSERPLGVLFLAWLRLQVYTNLPGNRSHVVNIAWAMLTLMAAGQVRGEMTGTINVLLSPC